MLLLMLPPLRMARLWLLPKKAHVPEGHLAVNQNNFRLDPYIAPPSPLVRSELMARINRHKICNSFHLNGACDGCSFDHTTDLAFLLHFVCFDWTILCFTDNY